MFGFYKRRVGVNKQYYRFVWRIFGVTPNNIELYKLALIHRSASVVLDDRSVINNERLEYLGDAVIETVVSELLFIEYPEMNEGALTQLRSRIVSRETLNGLAKAIGIDEEIIANPASINFHKLNIYGDALEALVGALYLDKGYNVANRELIKLFMQKLDLEMMNNTVKDFKSRVIEWCQKHRKTLEFQCVTDEKSGDINPGFESTLVINGQAVGYGSGRSKKEAEQRAAKMYFEEVIDSENAGDSDR